MGEGRISQQEPRRTRRFNTVHGRALFFTLILFSSAFLFAVKSPAAVDPVGEFTEGIVTPAQAADSISPGKGAEIEEVEKSPLGAMLRSAVIPGWGQFYTDHPYRGGLIFTAEGILLSLAWAEKSQADQDWETYKETSQAGYLDAYDRHFNRARDLSSLSIAVFLVNIADAYVSAHLYGFNGRIRFDQESRRLNISLAWKRRVEK